MMSFPVWLPVTSGGRGGSRSRGVSFPGGSLSRGSLSRRSLSRGVSVQGGLCPRVSVWGFLPWGVSVWRPPESEKRVVCILH